MKHRISMAAAVWLGACGADAEGSTGGGSSGEVSSSSTTSGSSRDASTTSERPPDLPPDLPPDQNADACEGAIMRIKPNDTASPGPWPVGVRTVEIDDLTVEVFYPAAEEPSGDPVRFDIRDALPPKEAAKISDAQNPWQVCGCGRDVAIDTAYGPYPVIVFMHGTAGWRTQSLRHLTHWASRGFVVLAADHPGLVLRDILGPFCGGEAAKRDLGGDVRAMLAAIRGQTSELAAFAAAVDPERIGMVGHSAGGAAIASFIDDARVIIPLAAGPTIGSGSAIEASLHMGGTADSVVSYDDVRAGYVASASPKRFVGLDGAGHLFPSEICSASNAEGQNLLEIADEAGVCGAAAAGFLFQCADDLLADDRGWSIVEYASAAAFESVLHCSVAVAANLDQIADAYPDVAESVSD